MVIAFWVAPQTASSKELKTRYVTLIYQSERQLRTLNDSLNTGGLSFLFGTQSSGLTLREDVKKKLDQMVEKVETVLGMYPNILDFKIVLHDSKRMVSQSYRRIYGHGSDFIAFYSPKENTVFFSAENLKLRVVAHELGHVVVENYYQKKTPRHLHEVLAQFAETHISK